MPQFSFCLRPPNASSRLWVQYLIPPNFLILHNVKHAAFS